MRKIELVKEEELEEKICKSLKDHKLPEFSLYAGEAGVKNWIALERSKKFPVASQLTKLLHENISSISRLTAPGTNVVSFGVGAGEKERIILEELIQKGDFVYYPVDISTRMVDIALETVRDLPVEKIGLVGFFEDLHALKSFWRFPVMLCMLGNSFCNYEPDSTLNMVHEHLHENDIFLFDSHLFSMSGDKESMRRSIEQIYRSPKNIFFNLDPLLSRGMDLGNCEFQLDLLPVQTSMGTVYKTYKAIHILKDSTINCGSCSVTFKAGDTVQLGFTYKYTFDQIMALLEQHNFNILRSFLSSDCENLLVLAQKQHTKEW